MGDLIEKVIADKHPGRRYFRVLPSLIAEARERIRNKLANDPPEVNCGDRSGNGTVAIERQLKRGGVLRAETFNGLIGRGESERRKAVWGEVIPALLACAEITKGKGAYGPAYRKALENLVRGAEAGNLEIITPACPPYDYMITRDGQLKHQSGGLLPSIGERFELAVGTLKEVFSPLTNLGVRVSFGVVTYTGETKNLRDLVELGGDVVSYYKGKENLIFENLQAATAQAKAVLERHWGENGGVVSIETTLAPAINAAVEEFEKKFPEIVANRYLLEGEAGKKVGQWLKEKFGVDEGWLLFFVEEEEGYRRKQGIIFDRSLEPLVLTAMKEGLLYLLVVKGVEESGGVMIDLETTENYMAGMLRHHPGPVIMGREFDWRNPFDPTRIR